MMIKFNLQHITEILQNTPGTLQKLLSNLPPELINANEGTETWSPYEVIAHMTSLEETNWINRIKIILENRNGGKFEPVNREDFREKFKTHTLNELLELFEKTRLKNVQKLKKLVNDKSLLNLRGIHPEFGEVTLQQLISTWAVHDLSHLAQILRVIAKQYKEEVGPWVAYLRITK